MMGNNDLVHLREDQTWENIKHVATRCPSTSTLFLLLKLFSQSNYFERFRQ